MKRSPLKRKTPLKNKTGFKPQLTLITKTNFLNIETKTTVNATARGTSAKRQSVSDKPKSRFGLLGVGRTKEHVEHHARVASTGCFVCNFLRLTPRTRLCIHHTAGRNRGKGGFAEWLVLCLCHEHHDPSSLSGWSTKGLSVHHNKKLFISTIGTEQWCVQETFKILGVCPPWLCAEEWADYLSFSCQADQENWIVNASTRTL